MKEPISIKVLKLTSKSTSKKFRFNSSDSYNLKLEMHCPSLLVHIRWSVSFLGYGPYDMGTTKNEFYL